jgi:hypothetical protein
MAARTYDPHTIRAISVRAHRDPRTVLAALDGRASPIATAAVLDAMRELGLHESLPAGARVLHPLGLSPAAGVKRGD